MRTGGIWAIVIGSGCAIWSTLCFLLRHVYARSLFKLEDKDSAYPLGRAMADSLGADLYIAAILSSVVLIGIGIICFRREQPKNSAEIENQTEHAETFRTFRGFMIRYWEKRRLAYNAALFLPALFGHTLMAGISEGLGEPSRYSAAPVLLMFILAAIGANVCYSLVYALEFLVAGSRWQRHWEKHGRVTLFVVGTFFAMFLALLGGRNIAIIQYQQVGF
jgi:hypothetical protein